jgi:hypothetical protein
MHATLLAGRRQAGWTSPSSGSATPATAMNTVYQQVHPGLGRQAAERFAALLRG